MPNWHTEQVRLGDLVEWEKNPRQLSKHDAEHIGISISKFGLADPLVVNADHSLIGGHQRKRVMLLNDYTKDSLVDVRVPDRQLTEREAEELAIRLNKNAGNWDWDMLANEFEIDDLVDWGFSTDELEGLDFGDEPVEDVEPQIDKAEELREKWGVETGQLWKLGEHRLICGDCTDKAVVDRVMGGEKANMCFTSPPYAAQRDYKIGDFDWDALMNGMSDCAIPVINKDGAILVNLGLVHREKRVVRYWDSWLSRMDNTEWPLFDWYVWDKINGLMGDWRGRLAPAHEWIFHFANEPRRAQKTEDTKYAENGITHYKKNKVGLREKDGNLKGFTQAGQKVSSTKVSDSVIRCQPARGGVEGHPAPFSVEFAFRLVEAFTVENEVVYEPFIGSGTTIIACEQLNRKCRAIEISPAYVAVAIQRWADATGGEPELVVE